MAFGRCLCLLLLCKRDRVLLGDSCWGGVKVEGGLILVFSFLLLGYQHQGISAGLLSKGVYILVRLECKLVWELMLLDKDADDESIMLRSRRKMPIYLNLTSNHLLLFPPSPRKWSFPLGSFFILRFFSFWEMAFSLSQEEGRSSKNAGHVEGVCRLTSRSSAASSEAREWVKKRHFSFRQSHSSSAGAALGSSARSVKSQRLHLNKSCHMEHEEIGYTSQPERINPPEAHRLFRSSNQSKISSSAATLCTAFFFPLSGGEMNRQKKTKKKIRKKGGEKDTSTRWENIASRCETARQGWSAKEIYRQAVR